MFEVVDIRDGFLLNSTLNSEEIDLDGEYLIFFLLSTSVGGHQENILGCSLEIDLNLSLSIKLEISNRLPKLSLISS